MSKQNLANNKICFIYCPFPNEHVAKKIAKELIEKKLVFCANILDKNNSIYLNDVGELTENTENIVIFKTLEENSNNLFETLEEKHPYQVPAIIKLDAVVNSAFIHAIREKIS